MPIFLPVGQSTFVDNTGYSPFVRTHWLPVASANRTRKVRRKVKKENTNVQKEVQLETVPEAAEVNKSKDDLELDFHGLSNMMRRVSFRKTRKWRLKSDADNESNEVTRVAKTEPTRAWTDEQEPDVNKNTWAARRPRSSSFIKYKYPKEFHKGRRSKQVALEENVPQCMRHYPRYTNLPRKQSCGYDPVRSVTKLKVHSITSTALPHPATAARKKRPMSAPAAYKTNGRPDSDRPPRPASAMGDHNGVFHVVYEEKEVHEHELKQPQIVMKGDYSDEEFEPIDSGRVPQDTIVSLEDFDENEEDSDQTDHESNRPTTARRKLERPQSPRPHSVSKQLDSADEMFEIASDSASETESIPNEMPSPIPRRPKTSLRRRKEDSSDADEVESDY